MPVFYGGVMGHVVKRLVMEDKQVLYLGRWVSKKHFRTFVYNKNEQKLANSYEEYSELISSGLWFNQPVKENEIKETFNESELKESEELVEESDNIVEIKPKRGRKCRNQLKR